MEKELNFQRKISFKPLAVSVYFGISISIIVYSLFTHELIFWISSGIIAFFIQSLVIYPHYFNRYYGYWRINKEGIYYYNYNNWGKIVKAILFPFNESAIKLPYSSIETFLMVDGKSIMNTKYLSGGPFMASLNRRGHYVIINTGSSKIKLVCDWKNNKFSVDKEDINQIVELLNSNIETKKPIIWAKQIYNL